MTSATTTLPRLARVSFTGRLLSMTRHRAGIVVREAGGIVTSTVSRRTTLLAVGMGGWPLLDDGTVSRKLRRAEQLNGQGASIEIIPESTFLELVGLEERQPSLEKSYDSARVCALLQLEPAVLGRWEAQGLVRSSDGQYDFRDIISLQTIAELIGRGVKPAVIARSVRGLASVLPGTDRPLAQLTLVEASGELCAELGDVFLAPDGQLVLNFEPAADDADDTAHSLSITAPAADPSGWTADQWFELGAAEEEEDHFEAAIDAYRAALARRSVFPEAHFNLGNVLRGLDRPDAAEAHFHMAVGQDPALATAWYNLADVQEELGRIDTAITSLKAALAVCPDFADAHYNLAACYEGCSDLTAAAHHWRAYLRLDCDSPWSAHARAHLARID